MPNYTLYFALGFSLFSISQIHAQTRSTGQILDIKTSEPVPFAHIRSDSFGTVSNINGYFHLDQLITGTITISHVMYEDLVLLPNSAADTLKLFLHPRITELEEVIIGVLPSEAKFKQELIYMEIHETKEEMNAQSNMRLATIMYLSGYSPGMSSMDNYKSFIRGPQGVSIFSSDPSKGLIKSFKNLSTKIRFESKTHQRTDIPLSIFKLKKKELNQQDSTVSTN